MAGRTGTWQHLSRHPHPIWHHPPHHLPQTYLTSCQPYFQSNAGLLVPGILRIVAVPPSSRVQLFETPWTTAHQASLPLTICWSLPKFMSKLGTAEPRRGAPQLSFSLASLPPSCLHPSPSLWRSVPSLRMAPTPWLSRSLGPQQRVKPQLDAGAFRDPSVWRGHYKPALLWAGEHAGSSPAPHHTHRQVTTRKVGNTCPVPPHVHTQTSSVAVPLDLT